MIHLSTRKISVSRDVNFHEKHFPYHIFATPQSTPTPFFLPSHTPTPSPFLDNDVPGIFLPTPNLNPPVNIPNSLVPDSPVPHSSSDHSSSHSNNHSSTVVDLSHDITGPVTNIQSVRHRRPPKWVGDLGKLGR